MIKMLIRLEKNDKKLLKIVAKQRGISEAAAVRKALELLFSAVEKCVTCGRKLPK